MTQQTTTKLMTVAIPDASASRSKMSKKGWKCWAKELTHVNSPANTGYDFDGEFCGVGSSRECEAGTVILHVDQSGSADLGVVYPNMSGNGRIRWVASADSDGRKWCGPLGKPARRLLCMTPAERVAEAARHMLENAKAPDNVDAAVWQAHYEALIAASRPDDPTAIGIEEIPEGNPLATYTDDQIRAEYIRRGL